MNYLVDLILIAIISLSAYSGYRKGLVNVAFGLLSFIVALVISIALYKPVANFIINNTSIDDVIQETIVDKLFASNITPEEIKNTFSNFSANIINITNSSKLLVADSITRTIINICSMIVVFIITKIALLIFKSIGELIASLPLLRHLNSAGGILYGLLKGFIIIYVLFAIISIISPFININILITLIKQSIIGNIMFNNNIIFILFG